jgi:hypothetical protein
MDEGFYSIAFTGVAGSGFGVLVLQAGIVVGMDAAGGAYDGRYDVNRAAGTVALDIVLTVPAGVTLVLTGVPLQSSLQLPIKVSLPSPLAGERTVRVDTHLGPVNVIIRKLRDFPSTAIPRS